MRRTYHCRLWLSEENTSLRLNPNTVSSTTFNLNIKLLLSVLTFSNRPLRSTVGSRGTSIRPNYSFIRSSQYSSSTTMCQGSNQLRPSQTYDNKFVKVYTHIHKNYINHLQPPIDFSIIIQFLQPFISEMIWSTEMKQKI